jgi:hypothetical protein
MKCGAPSASSKSQFIAIGDQTVLAKTHCHSHGSLRAMKSIKCRFLKIRKIETGTEFGQVVALSLRPL